MSTIRALIIHSLRKLSSNTLCWGGRWWRVTELQVTVVENLPANTGDTRDMD